MCVTYQHRIIMRYMFVRLSQSSFSQLLLAKSLSSKQIDEEKKTNIQSTVILILLKCLASDRQSQYNLYSILCFRVYKKTAKCIKRGVFFLLNNYRDQILKTPQFTDVFFSFGFHLFEIPNGLIGFFITTEHSSPLSGIESNANFVKQQNPLVNQK